MSKSIQIYNIQTMTDKWAAKSWVGEGGHGQINTIKYLLYGARMCYIYEGEKIDGDVIIERIDWTTWMSYMYSIEWTKCSDCMRMVFAV